MVSVIPDLKVSEFMNELLNDAIEYVNGTLIVSMALIVEKHVTTFHFYSINKSVHLLRSVFTFSCDI